IEMVVEILFFFSSRRRHTRFDCDWSSDVCSSDLGHAAIYATPGYEKLRRLIVWAVRRKVLVACIVLGTFLVSVAGMGLVKKQFFPQSDRPELLVEVTLPQGTSIEATNASAKKVEEWLRPQPEAKIVTAYIGAGAPRFFFSYNPELPNPNFAKIIV